MAVRSREIGWSNSDILKWELTKEIEKLTAVASKSNPTTTSTTTTTSPSDIRLKKSIRITGAKIGSLPEYIWEWNDVAISLGLGHHRTKGIMAHEALESYPDAVTVAEDGYLRVDYSKLN